MLKIASCVVLSENMSRYDGLLSLMVMHHRFPRFIKLSPTAQSCSLDRDTVISQETMLRERTRFFVYALYAL